MASNSTVNATQVFLDDQCKREALFAHHLTSGSACMAWLSLVIWMTLLIISISWSLAKAAQNSLSPTYSSRSSQRSQHSPEIWFMYSTALLAFSLFYAFFMVLLVQATCYCDNNYINMGQYIGLHVGNTLVTGSTVGTTVTMWFEGLQAVRRKELDLPWYWFILMEFYFVLSPFLLIKVLGRLVKRCWVRARNYSFALNEEHRFGGFGWTRKGNPTIQGETPEGHDLESMGEVIDEKGPRLPDHLISFARPWSAMI